MYCAQYYTVQCTIDGILTEILRFLCVVPRGKRRSEMKIACTAERFGEDKGLYTGTKCYQRFSEIILTEYYNEAQFFCRRLPKFFYTLINNVVTVCVET